MGVRRCPVCKRAPCVYRPRRQNRSRTEAQRRGALLGAAHRQESDEAVERELDPHEIALWRRTKGQFKKDPKWSRVEQFRHYLHDHPDAIYDSLERVSESALTRLLREKAALDKARRDVSVPCETPYRVRTKRLCAMANPKAKDLTVSARCWMVWISHEAFGDESVREYWGTELGARRLAHRLARAGGYGWKARWEPCAVANPRRKKGKRRNPLFESKKDRSRRLSDERLRKAAEKRSRRMAKGDATRKRRAKAKRPNPPAEFDSAYLDREAVKQFKRLHWDVAPESSKPRSYYVASHNRSGKPYVVLGELAEVGYLTRKGVIKGANGRPRPDRMTLWEHEFDKGKTFLLVNDTGELLIAKTSVTGGYRVTERGIVG